MELLYPVRQPIDQNNLFGTTSPMYTALGQLGHPGIDFECPAGTKVYAPCDGSATYATDKDGGCGIWLLTPDEDGVNNVIILWHMQAKGIAEYPYSISTEPGVYTPVKAGALLGYSGNTGFPLESTGAHLHVGKMPCDASARALHPDNGYLGCVDPLPFFNGKYADEINVVPAEVAPIVQAAAAIVPEIATAPTSEQPTLLNDIETVLKDVEEML